MTFPLHEHKDYTAPSVFTPESLLREARRQKAIAEGTVPAICLLDPDGDTTDYLIGSRQAEQHPFWACYHTRLYRFAHESLELGIIPYAVGSSFAVLVAEELFASGCRLLISVSSAGQIIPLAPPPYFILIETALRDEGTSAHYLPPARYSVLRASLASGLQRAFESSPTPVYRGATWTTDAPFRETASAIAMARADGILAVEMEAAALYAFAQARKVDVVCFAHVTNQMGRVDGDFEKGLHQGSLAALEVVSRTARAWLGQPSRAQGSLERPPSESAT